MRRGTISERLKCPNSRPIWPGETRITTLCTSRPPLRSTACVQECVGSCLPCRISGAMNWLGSDYAPRAVPTGREAGPELNRYVPFREEAVRSLLRKHMEL